MSTRVVAATDGSAINNPHGPAGWAWFVAEDCWAAGGFAKASNQVAELFAILALLRSVPREHALHVRTDSQFSIKCLTTWMPRWKSKGWLKPDGLVPANLSLLKELDRALDGRDVTFEWVRGHSGDPMNEIADRLCGAASDAFRRGTPVTGGPGWTGSPAPSAFVADLPHQRRPVTRAASPAGAVGAPLARRGASAGRSRAVVPAVAREPVRVRQDTSPIGGCNSCGSPVHPITFECRCSG